MSTIWALLAMACLIGCFVGLGVIWYTMALTAIKTVSDYLRKLKKGIDK